ncbi:c-type cytochrome [Nitrospira sp. T9]|uniref:c-type cytochrome n=1 Tax=unclassified Nitrospira TaxID=2652172 RepID=UPI003F950C28
MNEFQTVKSLLVSGLAVMGLLMSACGGGEGPPQPPPPAPPEYADKHMPAGYWNNPEILEEGKAIFTGQQNIDVNCASCHGKDGKPVKAGARDFRRTEQMQLYSDAVWFWRISEGVTGTKMKAWKSKLSEDAIWKVIAYEATFGLKGMEYDVAKKQWVPAGTAGSAPGGEAPAAEAPAGGEAEKAAE